MKSEKVKEIKKAIQETIDGKLSTEYLTVCEISCCPRLDIDKLFSDILTLINELESENKSLQDLCNKTYEDLTKEIDRLENRVKELEEGIAKSMLGCEFLPECTKEKEREVAEDFIKEIGKIQLQEYNGAELCLMLDLSQVLKKLAKKYRVKKGGIYGKTL